MSTSASARTGANIRAEMTRRGISQSRLAAHLGLSQAAISARLRGVTPVDVNELEQIARFFSIPPEALMAVVPEMQDRSA